ncbi:LytR/AlgR family response regulator transcription factor [Winogradskyella bathintestinalis]|uniref:Response regulator n=1 Tax=Winogradskyella bathintestinalis TaxID=3035208 RepID=A0ABT7ZRW0_9FLAO|nr:response regulator [Winogradskyella bathintestinalis]MDN3491544.1 response regulator [Winogradskyella bathintestinalis]
MIRNILIVEDELLIANLIKGYIEAYNYRCVGIAVDYKQAIELLNTKRIDLVLLDVTISSSKNGIDIANYINNTSQIPFIYLTSHSDQATLKQLEATEPNAYLSKPFKQIDIVTALNLVTKKIKNNSSIFELKIGKSIYSIDVDDLMYIKSDHVYLQLYFATTDNLLVRASIDHILTLFPKDSLVKVNRSTVVNLNYIKAVHGNIVELDTIEFKLSKIYKQQLERSFFQN